MKQNKVILISVDGMRPDGFLSCGNPKIHDLMARSYHSLTAQTVMPSVTLPCHMSMFHSAPPDRHGIMSNTYVPQVHTIRGLFEQLNYAGKVCAMYYGWEPLRDIGRPGFVHYARYTCLHIEENTDTKLTDCALEQIRKSRPDFVFLYLGQTDDSGHENGWMSEAYLKTISGAVDNICRVVEECGDEYAIIVTADHGGHDRMHGLDLPEDMTIPIFCVGDGFEAGVRFDGGSILNIAPTVAKLMDVSPVREWEGKSII